MAALKYLFGEVPITFAASPAGTYASGPLENAGQATMADVWVHLSLVSGTTVIVDVVIQTSPDGATWTTVLGSAITTLTAAGSARSCAFIPAEYVQVLATVGGTGTPLVTGAVGVALV
ncbi:MAG: hypothetical protein ACRDQU_00905 [Pseudonocardiaceae bacterium]